MIWMDTVHCEEVLGDGLFRPSQFPSIDPDEAQTIAYIFLPQMQLEAEIKCQSACNDSSIQKLCRFMRMEIKRMNTIICPDI